MEDSIYFRSSAWSFRRSLTRATLVSSFILLWSCDRQQAPTTEELRTAYAAHLTADPAHTVGLAAKSPPAVIPNQQPYCTADGNDHFDCQINVFYDVGKGNRDKRSARHTLHIRRDGRLWVIESLN